MSYFYLILAVISTSLGSVFCEFYNRKSVGYKNATQLFNFIRLCSTLAVWGVLFAFDFSFEWGVLWYSLGFGLCFALVNVCIIYAFQYGSVALTSLILQTSLIGVTIWGLIFWNAPFTTLVVVGLILVLISLALCIFDKKTDEKATRKNFGKWLFFAMASFIGNAGCSIIQREQQMAYAGKHGSMMMVFAVLISTLICLFLYLRCDRKNCQPVPKRNLAFPVATGVINSMLNLFVIILATSELSPSLIYPVLAVGGLAVTMLFSIFAFKEKLKWWQWIGIAVGAVAIALLNL